MQALLRLHGLSRTLHVNGWGRASRVLDLVTRMGFSASVPGRAKVGRGVFFHHSGIGVVVNGASVIEDGCEIGVHVVLGGRAPVIGAPHLEAGVIVHAGAKIIGPIRVGAGSVVAANAVVLEDVPARSLVAGVPAVVKRSGIDNTAYRHDAPVLAVPSRLTGDAARDASA